VTKRVFARHFYSIISNEEYGRSRSRRELRYGTRVPEIGSKLFTAKHSRIRWLYSLSKGVYFYNHKLMCIMFLSRIARNSRPSKSFINHNGSGLLNPHVGDISCLDLTILGTGHTWDTESKGDSLGTAG